MEKTGEDTGDRGRGEGRAGGGGISGRRNKGTQIRRGRRGTGREISRSFLNRRSQRGPGGYAPKGVGKNCTKGTYTHRTLFTINMAAVKQNIKKKRKR